MTTMAMENRGRTRDASASRVPGIFSFIIFQNPTNDYYYTDDGDHDQNDSEGGGLDGLEAHTHLEPMVSFFFF